MLKMLSVLLIAAMVTFTGCSSKGEQVSPSKHLEEQMEENNANVVPEKVMEDYLSSYDVELESEGVCPKCKKNDTLTNMGLCIRCSYDTIYMNEHDPELRNAQSDENNNSNINSNNTTNSTNINSDNEIDTSDPDSNYYSNDNNCQLRSNFGKDGKSTEKIEVVIPDTGKDSNGFSKVKVGNDGYYVTCNNCGSCFFDNVYDGCPNCGSSNYSDIVYTALGLGFTGNSAYDIVDIQTTTSEDIFNDRYNVLFSRTNGHSYDEDAERFVLQSFGGRILAIRDLVDNGKIVGFLFDLEDHNSINETYSTQVTQSSISFSSFGKINSVAVLDKIDSKQDNELFKAIGYYDN